MSLYPVYVVSGTRYIQFALNPVWIVIVEGDCLALITALESSPRNVKSGIRFIRNSLGLNHVWVAFLSKGTP